MKMEDMMKDFDELVQGVLDLLNDVATRYPEIEETKTFKCPFFQKLSELINFRGWYLGNETIEIKVEPV